jgi:hypothetical protein
MAVSSYFLLALCFAPSGEALYTSSWDDFANNFASDLAPIVALFGEQATKQFLSESSTIWDSIIFGVAPFGILTAVVSVIRIYGDSSLRSFIDRSQEAHGLAEAELCSSTSEDVCELWSNGGICRVFGRPKILEARLAESNNNGDFYPVYAELEGKGFSRDPASYHCGIKRPLDNFKPMEPRSDIESGTSSGSLNTHAPGRREISDTKTDSFATYPSSSFNIGIKKVPISILWAFATIGVLLQGSFFVYATPITFYHPDLYESGKHPV